MKVSFLMFSALAVLAACKVAQPKSSGLQNIGSSVKMDPKAAEYVDQALRKNIEIFNKNMREFRHPPEDFASITANEVRYPIRGGAILLCTGEQSTLKCVLTGSSRIDDSVVSGFIYKQIPADHEIVKSPWPLAYEAVKTLGNVKCRYWSAYSDHYECEVESK